MKSQDYIDLDLRFGAHNYHPLPVVISTAKACRVQDPEGKTYLDFLSAYSAVNQGHLHPHIVAAAEEQLRRVSLTSRAFHNDKMGPFLKALCEFTGYEAALPMNTGAEAVETAIKAARRWGTEIKGVPNGRQKILCAENNFHGRTLAAISMSSDPDSYGNYGPYAPGFVKLPFDDARAVEQAVDDDTVAVLVEPIQGEAGVVSPPKGFLKQAAEVCKTNNVLLIFDEVQCGLGRTGKMLASEHEGIKPDMITIGKALSGGMYPVSAVLSDREILGVLKPGTHGSTYGGNPLACAVAREALRVLVEEKLPENAAVLGDYLISELRKIETPYVDYVRGIGLWVGIVLKESAGGARRFCVALKERGILAKDTHSHIIRLAPPLVVTRADIDWAVGVIREVFQSI